VAVAALVGDHHAKPRTGEAAQQEPEKPRGTGFLALATFANGATRAIR